MKNESLFLCILSIYKLRHITHKLQKPEEGFIQFE